MFSQHINDGKSLYVLVLLIQHKNGKANKYSDFNKQDTKSEINSKLNKV